MRAEKVTADVGAAAPSLRAAMSARSRFAIAALALSLALAVGAPVLVSALGLPIEAAIFALASVFAVGIAYLCGARFDALERRSLEDPVTHVGNRRHWDERSSEEVERANRSRMPLSLLLVDLDNLKKLNDAHGHGCGDRALQLVGQVLLATCRSRDVAARFGGDEFGVLLPRTRVSEAKIVAERIRAELARRRHEVGLADVPVTVSIGIADLERAAAPRCDALFEAADLALYSAKRAGRDRVHVRELVAVSGVIRLDEVRAAKKRADAAEHA